MKKLLCMVLLLSIFLCSCRDSRELFADIKEDFSKFNASSDVALNMEDRIIYFNDYEVNIEELVDDGSQHSRVKTVCLRNDQMYILVSRCANKRWSFFLYRCDLKGNNLQVLYEKKDIDSDVSAEFRVDELLYFEYKIQKTVYVDLFNCITEEYLSLGSGKDISLEDYDVKQQRSYSVEESKRGFVISDDTKEIAVIDEDFLKNTEYYDLMKKHRFSPFQYSLTEDKITLIYRKEVFLPFSYYPMLLFEFDVASNSLIFLGVMNLIDCDWVYTLYNVKT